uniref:Transthyretin-like family protein n=1 Tax=Panagrolaimus sp. PS1159 TaxID=55785 RepID=A0AC35FVK8_9BILA
MLRFYFCLLIIFGAAFFFSDAKEQSVKVFGKIWCNNMPLPNHEIKLMEHDTLDPDDLLNTVQSDRSGRYRITGSEDEITTIKPYLRVNHTCGVNADRCYRISDYTIPAEAIDSAGFFEMKKISLNVKGDLNDKKTCN